MLPLPQASTRSGFIRRICSKSRPAASPTIRGNPFLLQQAVFFCFNRLLDNCRSSDRLSISLSEEDGGVLIALTSSPAREMDASAFECRELRELLGELGGRSRVNGEECSVTLHFPGEKSASD